MNKGDANIQGLLENSRECDVVFAAEPPINTNNVSFHCSFLVNMRPASQIQARTKLVAYVARDSLAQPGTRVRSHRAGTAIAVTLKGRTICGVYLPGNGSLEDLEDDLECSTRAITVGGGGQIAGDFNCEEGSRRRRTVEEWAAHTNLASAYSNGTSTWFRIVDGEVLTSSLDLVFSSPHCTFLPGPGHLEFTGSDHCSLAGTCPSLRSGEGYVLPGIDWTWWEEFAHQCRGEEEAHGEGRRTWEGSAYTHLARLTQTHQKPIKIAPQSKRWWNQDLSLQLLRVRSAAMSREEYKKERKVLKRMIRERKLMMMMMIVSLLVALKGHVEPAGSPTGFRVPSS